MRKKLRIIVKSPVSLHTKGKSVQINAIIQRKNINNSELCAKKNLLKTNIKYCFSILLSSMFCYRYKIEQSWEN